MRGLKIVATGASVPKNATSNEQMSKIVDTSDEWISTRTGIKQRYFCKEGESATTLAVNAAKMAIENSGVDIYEIGVCLVATFTPEYSTPSTACLLQKALNMPEKGIYLDVNAACSGFLYALHTAHALLHTSQKKYALIVGTEKLSSILDFSDRNTCVLFGDGAGAVIVCLEDFETHPYYAMHGANGDENALYAKGVGNKETYLHMDGPAVFRFAVGAISKTCQELMQMANLTEKDLAHVVCHQANNRIISTAAKKLEWSDDLFYRNMQKYGNTSAASIPIALHELYSAKRIKSQDRVLCVGFGAGLTWGAALITF